MRMALGDMLRKAREAKGLSMDQLSALTRLNKAFIEALEEGRWDKLPGQVYLRPFAKTCAEALDLDLKEVYRAIDGDEPEKPNITFQMADEPPKKRKLDYKLPLVLIVGFLIVAIIIVGVKYQRGLQKESVRLTVVPAGATRARGKANWSRIWQKPAKWELANPGRHRLRLEASDQVWISVLTDTDTLFAGFLNPGQARSMYSGSGFILNLGRNDCLTGFFDGRPVSVIGTSEKGLYNYRLDSNAESE